MTNIAAFGKTQTSTPSPVAISEAFYAALAACQALDSAVAAVNDSASAGRSTSVPEAMATTRRFSLCNHTGAHSFCGVDAMCSPTAAAMRTPIDETVSTVATASGSKDWVGTFGSAHQTLTTAAATLRE